MTNATSVICHKFLQQSATLSQPDWEKPESSVVALPCCDHIQMDPSYLWSGPVTEHAYKTACHPLRLPVLSVLCLRRFYRLGWIYDCDAAVALKPPQCDQLAAHLWFLTEVFGVWRASRSPSYPWWLNGGITIQPGIVDIMEAPGVKGFLGWYGCVVPFTHTHTHTQRAHMLTHRQTLTVSLSAILLHTLWHDLQW